MGDHADTREVQNSTRVLVGLTMCGSPGLNKASRQTRTESSSSIASQWSLMCVHVPSSLKQPTGCSTGATASVKFVVYGVQPRGGCVWYCCVFCSMLPLTPVPRWRRVGFGEKVTPLSPSPSPSLKPQTRLRFGEQ